MKVNAFLKRESVFSSPSGHHKGKFSPRGNPCISGKRTNPEDWSSIDAPLAARFFVGFNVGHTPVYKMDDLVPIVKGFLKEKGMPQDSSFVYQRGVYTHSKSDSRFSKAKSGEIVTEEGAQIIILKFPYSEWDTLSAMEFREMMKKLAETIAEKLQQESVIVQFSRGGVEMETTSMTPA